MHLQDAINILYLNTIKTFRAQLCIRQKYEMSYEKDYDGRGDSIYVVGSRTQDTSRMKQEFFYIKEH